MLLALAAGASTNEGLPVRQAQGLPDELTLNVGAVSNIGENVTLVLRKRSVRSDDYLCGIWTDNGFEKRIYPVRTYRGYVKGDPTLRVNGSILPGNLFRGAFSEGRLDRARIFDVKVEMGNASADGSNTFSRGTGNREVPLEEVAPRRSATPGGYLVPRHPMRCDRWTVLIPTNASYLAGEEDPALLRERAVAVVEQRFNNADFVYARDVGSAWEIRTLVIAVPGTTREPDWSTISEDGVSRRPNTKLATMHGNRGPNASQLGLVWAGYERPCGDILLHEAGHTYGLAHHLEQDCMHGGAFHLGPNNIQVICQNVDKGELLNPAHYPTVVYSDALPPYAMDDIAGTRRNTPVTIDVLDNDYDGNGDELALQSVTPKSKSGGTVVVAPDQRRAVYTPPVGFVGLDTFVYTVTDSTGIGNRTGTVKVDVREPGLAAYYSFDHALTNHLEADAVCRFANSGAYGGDASVFLMDYQPAPGVHGNGLYNPRGGNRGAHVSFDGVGDPGRGSLSVSLWVLYPDAVDEDAVILGKGGVFYSMAVDWVVNGWAIAQRKGGGFKFTGNVARSRWEDAFDLESKKTIQPNRWYHLAMVIDREQKKLRAWVNNEEISSSKNTASIPDGALTCYAPMTLFNGVSSGRWRAAHALVDELKVFTSALTPEQVAELYAEGKDVQVPALSELASKAKPMVPGRPRPGRDAEE